MILKKLFVASIYVQSSSIGRSSGPPSSVQSSSTGIKSGPPSSVLKNYMFAPFPVNNSRGLTFSSSYGEANSWLMVDLGRVRFISAVQVAQVRKTIFIDHFYAT